MKKIIFLSICYLLISQITFAQFSQRNTEWFPGIIILENDEIINGDLSYDFANDLVMCKKDDKIQTFGPHQATAFRFFNKDENVFHNYEVFSVQENSFYSRKAFFEVILEGDVNYVRKHNRYPVYELQDGYVAHRKINEHKVAYDYFVEVDDQLIRARRFKKEVLPTLLLHEQSVAQFIKENKLRTYDIGDQIVLLNYYNSVSEKAKPTALSEEASSNEQNGTD